MAARVGALSVRPSAAKRQIAPTAVMARNNDPFRMAQIITSDAGFCCDNPIGGSRLGPQAVKDRSMRVDARRERLFDRPEILMSPQIAHLARLIDSQFAQ